MAELVDAPASGAGARKGVEVRVLFWAPFFSTRRLKVSGKPRCGGFLSVSSSTFNRPIRAVIGCVLAPGRGRFFTAPGTGNCPVPNAHPSKVEASRVARRREKLDYRYLIRKASVSALGEPGISHPRQSIGQPSNARPCPPPELLACRVQMTAAAMLGKVGWIVGAALGQRYFVINFHHHSHPGGLHAKWAGRRRLSPGSASPHSGQFGRAILVGLRRHAKALLWASVQRRRVYLSD